MLSPTSFPDLNEVLDQLSTGVRRALGPDLVGIYLQGSFAMGDADEGSDVDFMVVTREPLSAAQRDAVQALHRTVYDLPSPWAQHLEGSYFPAALLRRPDPAHTPVPYFNHGSRDLEFSPHDNTVVVRWTLREHGAALIGPPARDLLDPLRPDDLRQEVQRRLRTFGTEQLADTRGLDNGWRQPYVALCVARMLQTLSSGAVHSKRAAVDWARVHLDARWTPLLDRAWSGHPAQATRYQQLADPTDLALTREFIQFALDRPAEL